MQALAYWKAVTQDRADFLDEFLAVLTENSIHYCVIGGQGVNAYAEPLVSLDLDVAVAAEDLVLVERLLASRFRVGRFEHSLHVSATDSQLRVQIQMDPRYFAFVPRAAPRQVLGVTLQVAAVEDVLQGKLWAFLDETRRGTKRQKDLADIGRLIEAYPHLRPRVPDDVFDRLI
ncbi:MAG TPA: nucleotidyl transferase AbiEii/AbiGii toxin family protein [Thermoanaerobaculia bacterium]